MCAKFMEKFSHESFLLILPINLSLTYNSPLPLSSSPFYIFCLSLSLLGLLAISLHYLLSSLALRPSHFFLFSLSLLLLSCLLSFYHAFFGICLGFCATEILEVAATSITGNLTSGKVFNPGFILILAGLFGRVAGYLSISFIGSDIQSIISVILKIVGIGTFLVLIASCIMYKKIDSQTKS
jgi:hypothetical protein